MVTLKVPLPPVTKVLFVGVATLAVHRADDTRLLVLGGVGALASVFRLSEIIVCRTE